MGKKGILSEEQNRGMVSQLVLNKHHPWHFKVVFVNGPFPLLRHTPESAWCILVVVVKPADICLYSLRQSHGILSLLFIILRKV